MAKLISKVEKDALYFNYSSAWNIKYLRLEPMIDHAQAREEMFGIGYNYEGWPINYNIKSVTVVIGIERYWFSWESFQTEVIGMTSKDKEEFTWMTSRWELDPDWLFQLIKIHNPWK